MKKLISAAFTVALTVMCVSAQPPQGGPGGPGGQGGPRGPMTPKARVEQMDKQLSLSDEQKAKLTEIFTKQDSMMKKQFEEMEEGERPDREQMKAEMEKRENEVKAVLNDEQKAKYEELRKQRRPGPGGPGGPGEGPGGPKPEDE